MGIRSSDPTATSRVSTEACDATRNVTVWQRNRRPAFFCKTPGSNPASHSTWNPLQMPTTGPPDAAKSATASITGENRAMAPGRR